jgi:cyclin K
MQPTTDSTAQPLQWLFPISALSCTPTAQDRSLHEEMYDRSRGIEFLYRLGTSIGLFVLVNVTSSICTQTLVPQPFPRAIHCCNMVSSLFHAIFYDRLSPTSQFSLSSPSLSLPWATHSTRHQTVAAACIFLATKTEECGRKLRDVARVCQSKAKGIDVRDIPESGPVRLFFRALRSDESTFPPGNR